MLPISSSTVRKSVRLAALLAAALLFAGCGQFDGPMEWFSGGHQSTFEVRGPVAQQQLDLFYVTLWVTLFIFVTVGGVLAYATFRFRQRPGDAEKPPPAQTHGHPLVEIGLIAAAVLLLVIIAVPTVRAIYDIYELPEDEDMLVIDVIAYQWWWAFEYPDEDVVTANEVAIPVGRKVKFNLRTVDVIHSFWVPRLGGKIDMIPNRDNWLWLQADEPGQYWGQCAEFCGESHANMKFRVFAYEEDEFQAWLEDHRADAAEPDPEDELAVTGAELFRSRGCMGCHTIQGTGAAGMAGPDLTHFGRRQTLGAGMADNTPENLFHWMRDPDGFKPGNLMALDPQVRNLSEEDIEALSAYLQTLK